MKDNLVLVKLNPDQISRAKEANGSRKRITHGLICGPYGQMFGSEKQCLKCFTVWDPAYRIEAAPGKFESMFPGLFDKAVRTDKYEITDYKSTSDLTEKLIKVSESAQGKAQAREQPNRRHKVHVERSTSTKSKKRSGFFGRLFSRR